MHWFVVLLFVLPVSGVWSALCGRAGRVRSALCEVAVRFLGKGQCGFYETVVSAF